MVENILLNIILIMGHVDYNISVFYNYTNIC